MTLKEYEAQLALGTVDFCRVANETKSSIVLQDIIGRVSDPATLLAVATNLKANIYTLTLLATFPMAYEDVIAACVWHPRVTLKILERWMEYPAIAKITTARHRMRILQLVSGVSYDKAMIVEVPSTYEDVLAPFIKKVISTPIKTKTVPKTVPWTTPDPSGTWVTPSTSEKYVIWTTTGNNTTIRMSATTFKFSSDDKTYYEYTPVAISSSSEVKK